MIQIMGVILESSVLVFFLCIPPLVLLMMLSRRYNWTLSSDKRLLRYGMYASGAAIFFNLCVSLFAAPRFQVEAISDGIDTLTLMAIILAWASIWGALALAFLAPRRRYKLAASRAA
ncbi:MAG: hypothetical protein DI533_04990 [Cereibacter sphaeroides]|uniref:Transmembrane protein n=1 Tax=Cereibacter sphaeroides TaxID=1063 RepID=A0A2W5SGP6_CERSP|nr:MAG: hypothetical protein DI533_04990 [Cereibacter sphaeroides]